MKRVLTVVLALALGVLAFGATGLAAEEDFSRGLINRKAAIEAAKKVTREKYPNADEVAVDRMEWIRYKDDGTYVQWAEEYNKVLTEKARRRNSTLASYFTIPYQRGPEDCNVPLVEIIKPDGKVVTIDVKKNSKLMINPSGMGSNIYNPNSKVIRINVPGLEVGDVLHYVMYDRVVQSRIKDTFCDWHGFEGTRPIVHSVVEIRGPKTLPLKRIVIKDPVAGTLVSETPVEKGDEITYRWEAHDVPRMFPEPDMPPVYMVTQRVLMSTAPDWQTISRWYWKLSKPHFEHTPEMKAEVAKLTKGLADEQEKIKAIFKFVSQKIRYMGITAEAEAPGYEPHDVKDTFEQKHGVCRDKAALLVVMLRLGGFDAFPVLIHNGPKKDEEVPQPYFNHAITAMRAKDGTYILMDPTDESTRRLLPAYLNNKSYLVATPEGDTLRTSAIVPAEKNLMRIETTGTVDADGNLKARTALHFDGINDNAYRGYFARSKPEVRRRYFEGAIQRAAAGAKLTALKITPENMQNTAVPLSVQFDFEAPDVLVRGGGHVMLPVPALGQRIGIVNFIIGRTGLKKRKYPMMTGYACGARETVEIRLDPSLRDVVLMPTSAPVDDEALSWKLAVRRDGDTLKADGDFRLKVVEFSPAQYLTLKKTLKTIELDLKKMPIFRDKSQPSAKKLPPGDILVLDADIIYELTDARNWTETRRVKFKVLSYAGKKRHSELKIGYNPAWEAIELKRAVVTSKDGKVTKISKKEINVMDAPGAGTAPRYPVPKTFVASLPGVEVGSTVAYWYTRTCKNRPFFACRESFQSFDAIRKKTLRVIVPTPGTLLKKTTLNRGRPLNESRSLPRAKSPGLTRFRWSAENVPALQREDMLPPRWSYTPTVFVSTGTWKTLAAQVYPALWTKTLGQWKSDVKARELVRGKPAAADKVKAIRDFVVLNVRKAGPSLAGMPLKYVTRADVTLADGYGNTTDRAVLLYTMLRATGFRPEFVLASGIPRVEAMRKTLLDHPDTELFGTVLVRVKAGKDTVYLNTGDQYSTLGATVYDGYAGLVLPSGKIETIRAAEGKADVASTSYRMTLNARGDATITKTRRLYGTSFGTNNRKFSEMRPEDRRRYYLELVAKIAQNAEAVGDLRTDFAAHPGVEGFTVKVKDFAVRDGDFLYLDLPQSLAGLFYLRSDKRENPLYLGEPEDRRLTVEVTCPKGYEPVMLPKEVAWKTADGTVRVQSVRRAGGTLVITAKATLAPMVVSPAKYGDLFELNRKLSHRASRLILLRKTPTAVVK